MWGHVITLARGLAFEEGRSIGGGRREEFRRKEKAGVKGGYRRRKKGGVEGEYRRKKKRGVQEEVGEGV